MTTISAGGRPATLHILFTAACTVLAALSMTSNAVADALPLTLDEAQELAVENSDALAMARAGAEAARARLAQATAGFFPAIAASATYTRLDEAPYMDISAFGGVPGTIAAGPDYLSELATQAPAAPDGRQDGTSTRIYLGSENIYSIGLSATQPIFTGGALLSARGAAKHGARAGELSARRAEQTLRYNVTQAYVGLVQARAALAVMNDMEAQMRQHLADAEAMYEQGMLLESDLLSARVRMSQVELDQSRAEHLVKLAGAGLAFVIGIDIDTEIEPVDGLDDPFPTVADLGALTRRALESRPDLLAAREMAGAADNAVSLARSDYFPKLAVVGNYNWDRPNRRYEPEFYSHWSWTLALQMNVLDWGHTWNRVREARAGLDQAERSRDMLEESVRLDVRRSQLALDEAVTAVVIAGSGLSQARESMRVVREGFRNGTATNTDVLAAQTALTSAEMNHITSLAQLKTAEAGLELATGMISKPEETR
ncbi:MAG: TolC family protein [Candidatus Eisenbacteria bacterium]|nr:TolC family protein [Candidatus Eisenbacteria bacterium]